MNRNLFLLLATTTTTTTTIQCSHEKEESKESDKTRGVHEGNPSAGLTRPALVSLRFAWFPITLGFFPFFSLFLSLSPFLFVERTTKEKVDYDVLGRGLGFDVDTLVPRTFGRCLSSLLMRIFSPFVDCQLGKSRHNTVNLPVCVG